MKATLAVLLLATMATAQDSQATQDAADLFYKAYWLEQSGHDPKKAESLYDLILETHAQAPEAPRALLAMIRIRAARGEDVTALRAKFKDYPKAVRERERAERIGKMPNGFDPRRRNDDEPLAAALKDIYWRMISANVSGSLPVNDQQVALIADLGERAHPMLAKLVQSSNPHAVTAAAKVLLLDGQLKSLALLKSMLADARVVYRGAVFEALISHIEENGYPKELLAIVRSAWDAASHRVRVRISKCAALGAGHTPDAFTAFVLGKVLEVPVEERPPYLVEWNDGRVPASLELAPATRLLEAVEQGASGDISVAAVLWMADHETLRPRIEKLLVATGATVGESSIPAASAEVVMRAAIARLLAGKKAGGIDKKILARPAVRDQIARAALDHKRADIASTFAGGKYGWEITDATRHRAIDGVFSEDKALAGAAERVLSYAPPQTGDWERIVALVRKHDRLPARFVSAGFNLGPAELARVAPYAKDRGAASALLRACAQYRGGPTHRRNAPLFPLVDRRTLARAALEHISDTSQRSVLIAMVRRDDYADLVLSRILRDTTTPWLWQSLVRHQRPLAHSLLSTAYKLKGEAARLYYPHVTASYETLATTAVNLASKDESEHGVAALNRALQSPHESVVSHAIDVIGRRGKDGSKVLLPFLDTKYSHLAMRALERVKDPRHVPVLEKFLAKDEAPEKVVRRAWHLAHELEPSRTAALAFDAVRHSKRPAHVRRAALAVLAGSTHSGRLEVFRAVLARGKLMDFGGEAIVLGAVGDQYLHELGPLVLEYLRHPDARLRKAAHDAVKRIQFYVEAKRILDKARDGRAK